VLLLALTLGLISAVLIYVYLSNAAGDGGGSQTSGPTQPVVVAAGDIPVGSRITADMVEVKLIPKTLLLSGVFADTESVVGQVTSVAMSDGEQILSTRLSTSGVDLSQFGDKPPLSVVIPDGMRGVSIEVSEVAASGGLVRPGDYVDVLMAFTPILPAGDPINAVPVAACYVLQDVQVLAVSQDVTRVSQGESSGGASLSGSNPNPSASSATLAVTPGQAWQLTAAQDHASQLWLSLRPFGDRGEVAGLPQCTLFAG
jgi:pilus assembly protein CpaB